MNKINEELYELENYGSGFSNFLKDQSKKFIKKAVEKTVTTGSEAIGDKFGNLIANKIKSKTPINNPEIPIDSGYKIIKILQKNPVDNIRTQFNSI